MRNKKKKILGQNFTTKTETKNDFIFGGYFSIPFFNHQSMNFRNNIDPASRIYEVRTNQILCPDSEYQLKNTEEKDFKIGFFGIGIELHRMSKIKYERKLLNFQDNNNYGFQEMEEFNLRVVIYQLLDKTDL